MPVIDQDTVQILVSSRILRHIGRGIYRSPAGALKELVSNAYDAGATKITINTSYPVIDVIRIIDDGKGITKDEFIDIIQRIGFSEKNVGDEIIVPSTGAKRNIIGHYGIGFLAMGQLTSTAIITSKTANSSFGIKATLDFDQFEIHTSPNGKRVPITKDEKLLEKADREKFKNKKVGDVKLSIGTCKLETIEFDEDAAKISFTKVELPDVRPDVRDQLLNFNPSKLVKGVEQQKQYSATFENVIALLRTKEQQSASQRITDRQVPRVKEYFYEKLLWELAVYSPLKFPDHPQFDLKNGELEYFQKLANKSKFEVIVDGFVLTKPYEKYIWEQKQTFSPKIFNWENEKYYKDKRASAFLIYQPSTMIRPKIMQGVVVRENGVAVGLYDSTFLRYPFNEGAKFNSLTGEIFAEGLSGAMNIDRDSFNQTAEEFVALTEWFHSKLYNNVFTQIQKLQKAKESPSSIRNVNLVEEISAQLIHGAKKIKKVEFRSFGKEEKRRLILKDSKLMLNSDHKDCELNTAKREKILFAIALILKNLIKPEDFEKVSDEIERAKKLVRNKNEGN
jgi:hypothetical protein